MSLPITTITAAIKECLGASLADKVTVYDLNEIKDQIDNSDEPMLYPEPRGGFISEFNTLYQSNGGEGQRAADISYKLRYTFAYSPVGSGGDLADIVPQCYDLTKTIADAAFDNDKLGGAVDEFLLSGIVGEGIVTDPVGNSHFGFTFLFEVTELIN